MNFRNYLFLLLLSFGLFTGCDENITVSDTSDLVIMTYNTQTFFDAVTSGSEFSDFRGSEYWSADAYSIRLDRLCEVLYLAGQMCQYGKRTVPDIVVLQEIENADVLRDLCNRLHACDRYPYAVFVPPDDGCAFSSGLLSMYPVVSVSVHSLGNTGFALRPLLEIELNINGSPLVVFAVHWKSKADDADTTTVRHMQETLLYNRIQILKKIRPDVAFIACGDFNQKPEEFTIMNQLSDCWTEWFDQCAKGTVAGPCGSYRYQDNWEAIDHFFYDGSLTDGNGLEFGSFQVLAREPLITSDMIPARYELYSGKGYSDHLPLLLSLRILK